VEEEGEHHYHYHRRWKAEAVPVVAEVVVKDRPRVGLVIAMEALVSLGEGEV